MLDPLRGSENGGSQDEFDDGGERAPLHTLPHDELIAKLKTLTNLRVVRDEEAATGWKLTHDPFPGWETVPEW